MRGHSSRSQHTDDELVDVLFSVAPGTTTLVGVSLLLEALGWGVKLEGPEEVVGLLEVGSDGPELVDEVLDAGDSVLSEGVVNDGVVVDGDSGAVNLSEATGVDELGGGGAGGVSVGDEGFNETDHVPGSTVELDEGTVMELTESEELHDLLLLGGKLVDTSDSDHESDLGLGFDEDVTSLLGVSLVLDEGSVGGGVLLGVLLGVGASGSSLGLAVSLGVSAVLDEGGEHLSVAGSLLDDVFGDNSCLCPKTHQQMS